MFEPGVIMSIIPSFLSFSLVASSGYIINDIMDRESDRNHVSKKDRPIASGDVSVVTAIILAASLCAAGVVVSSTLSRTFEGFLIIYFFVSVVYSLYFKHRVIIDIFFVSFGFLIRVLAGGEAFQVVVSGWLFLTVFVVSLLLAAGKRMGELITMGNDAHKQRSILIQYSPAYLEGVLWFSAAASLVTYALYALEHHNRLYYTVPVVAFGLLRYIYTVKEGKGDPTNALLQDRQIMGVGIIWAAMIGFIIYR